MTFVDFALASTDGRAHRAEIYFDASSQLAVDHEDQAVNWGRVRVPGLDVQFCGAADQRILERTGDDRRIDWGFLYLAVSADDGACTAIRTLDAGPETLCRGQTAPGRRHARLPAPGPRKLAQADVPL